MRRGSTRYDRDLDTPTSCEDYSSSSSELDQQNQRAAHSYKGYRVVRTKLIHAKNLQYTAPNPARNLCSCCQSANRKINKLKLPQKSSSVQCLPVQNYTGTTEVTFVEGKYSSGGGEPSGKASSKLWTAKGTPKIVKAIRQSSKKLHPEEDRSVSLEQPKADNSKSSVVILYHGKSPPSPSSSSKALVRSSKSDQTILQFPTPRQAKVKPEVSLPLRTNPVESPEGLSPRYQICRRKTAIRRYRHTRRRYEPLNVNIYHESRVVQVSSPNRDYCTQVEGLENKSKGRPSAASKDVFRSQGKSFVRESEHSRTQRQHQKTPYKAIVSETFKDTSKDIPREQCQSNLFTSKLMAYYSTTVNEKKKEETEEEEEEEEVAVAAAATSSQRKQSGFCSNLGFLMQRAQTHSRESSDGRGFINSKESEETKRVFPFQATPSGNLKIIPNQVVYECEKLSVLVADPQGTKINVELNRPAIDTDKTNSESTCRPGGTIDLPPGVTASTIHQLQAQKRLPDIETRYRPRTQPHKPKSQQVDMDQASQQTCHRTISINEVPLSSLGFTGDQPIDWDNIILPEKTDLYQELARRIINYKNADCIVRLGNDEFHCHLLVLQSYSTFFDERNCKEVDLTGSSVTSKAFSIVYDWMISPTSESCHLLRRDNILEIFTAAQYLGIKELEEQCWAFIDNDELFSEDTAFLLYLDARKVGNKAVMELMVPRIMKFFLLLVSTKDFLDLSVDELCLLLKSNYISVNSEMEVLMSAVRWLMHDWENRQKYMLSVLKCVRFGLIAPWQLVDVKRNPENPEFMELMSCPEVQKMVDDGLAFVIIKYWYGSQTEDYYRWIELLGLTEPTNRNWAGEDKNYVTYQEFLLYLEEYQQTQISELKSRKERSRPSPPTSPPIHRMSDQQNRNHIDHIPNYSNGDMSGSGQGATASNNEIRNFKYPPNIPFPPEMLKNYFVGRGDIKGVSKSSTSILQDDYSLK